MLKSSLKWDSFLMQTIIGKISHRQIEISQNQLKKQTWAKTQNWFGKEAHKPPNNLLKAH